MLLSLMRVFAYLYVFAWFVWPFVFVFGLAFGIADLVKGEEKSKGLLWASIALLVITCGLSMSQT